MAAQFDAIFNTNTTPVHGKKAETWGRTAITITDKNSKPKFRKLDSFVSKIDFEILKP